MNNADNGRREVTKIARTQTQLVQQETHKTKRNKH